MASTVVGAEEKHLAQFVETAKGLNTEAALIALLQQVLSSPEVYVFGELLELENVQKLKNSENGNKMLSLLEIFAFGDYKEYKAHKEELPSLSERQSRKLKQLSIVSLAAESRFIAYDKLLSALDVANLRELEDLVIDALYRNIFTGKLDHASSHLQVDSTIGRDIREGELDFIVNTFDQWEKRTLELITTLDKQIEVSENAAQKAEEHKKQYEKSLENMRENVKATLEAEVDLHSSGSFMNYMRDDQRRGKKEKKHRGF